MASSEVHQHYLTSATAKIGMAALRRARHPNRWAHEQRDLARHPAQLIRLATPGVYVLTFTIGDDPAIRVAEFRVR